MFGYTKHSFINSYGDLGSSPDGVGRSLIGGYRRKQFILFGVLPISIKTNFYECDGGSFETALRDFDLDRTLDENSKTIYERIIIPFDV